ncbi:hypothetical protein [Devosia sp. Root635]|uniref:PD-(D/E)XK nuclease domain-containing protein n=1 Tax=Devosia sp. Root635 TaxID=1736575 RepID=UPI0006F8995D|nr:hypothetical protein [Devosia sp. Root635]KRA42031.1 hypothetical protein ASD80_09910 [Devosia sp. Root635]
MDELEKVRAAGRYFQDYTEANIPRFGGIARAVNPAEGYGNGEAAAGAHNAALFLYHYLSDQFSSCRIPQDFASPAHFEESLKTLDLALTRDITKLGIFLTDDYEGVVPGTVQMVLPHLESCRSAVSATLAQIDQSGASHDRDTASHRIQQIAARFPSVVARLAKSRKAKSPIKIDDEYDVQHLFQGLLELYFDDIRPEEGGKSVAGGGSRADTFLPIENVVIEYKMTRTGTKNAGLRKQIADDFLLYEDKAETLIFFVYDPGKFIQNPRGFERDLSKPRTPFKSVIIIVQQH